MPTSRPTLTPDQMQMLRALADNDMNVCKTARELHRDPKGLRYHLIKIRKCTGLNPMGFYDLHELLNAREASPDG